MALSYKFNHYFCVRSVINYKYLKSNEIFKQTYKVFYRLNRIDLAGETMSDIVDSYLSQSKYDSALIYSIKAETLLKKSNQYYYLTNNYNLKGLTYQSIGNFNLAINSFFKGLEIADNHNLTYLRGILLYNLSNCYYDLNDKEKAAEKFKLYLSQVKKKMIHLQ